MNPASHGHHERGGSTDSAAAQTSTASNSRAVDFTAGYSSSWLAW